MSEKNLFTLKQFWIITGLLLVVHVLIYWLYGIGIEETDHCSPPIYLFWLFSIAFIYSQQHHYNDGGWPAVDNHKWGTFLLPCWILGSLLITETDREAIRYSSLALIPLFLSVACLIRRDRNPRENELAESAPEIDDKETLKGSPLLFRGLMAVSIIFGLLIVAMEELETDPLRILERRGATIRSNARGHVIEIDSNNNRCINNRLLSRLNTLIHLEKLDLYGTGVNTAGLEHLKGLKNLKELRLPDFILPRLGNREHRAAGYITADGFSKLSRTLPNCRIRCLLHGQVEALAALEIRGNQSKTDGDGNVVSLFLSFTNITDADLVHLTELKKLESLRLDYTKITGAGLEHLQGLTNLNQLKLNDSKITDTGLVHLKGLTGLKLLVLNDTEITDAGLVHLKGLTQLQQLSLNRTQVTDVGLEYLTGLKRLEKLSLNETEISEVGLANLRAALPDCKIGHVSQQQIEAVAALRELGARNITSARYLPDQGAVLSLSLSAVMGSDGYLPTKISDAGLVHLQNLSSLKSLFLANTKISDAGLEHLKGMNQLEKLVLVGTQISDAGLEHLKGMKLASLTIPDAAKTDVGLKHFLAAVEASVDRDFAGWKITDNGLLHLKGLATLKKLDLGGTEITDSGLEHLQGLSDLRYLTLDQTQVTDAGLVYLKELAELKGLVLSSTQISDEALVHLQELTSLRVLNLTNTKISDAGLVHLQGLLDLRYLGIGKTKITDAGADELQKSLPNCEISH